jgi:hypothetical protein
MALATERRPTKMAAGTAEAYEQHPLKSFIDKDDWEGLSKYLQKDEDGASPKAREKKFCANCGRPAGTIVGMIGDVSEKGVKIGVPIGVASAGGVAGGGAVYGGLLTLAAVSNPIGAAIAGGVAAGALIGIGAGILGWHAHAKSTGTCEGNCKSLLPKDYAALEKKSECMVILKHAEMSDSLQFLLTMPGASATARAKLIEKIPGASTEAKAKFIEAMPGASTEAKAMMWWRTTEAVAQHPSHPTGTLLRTEPRDDSPFCRVEVPNGSSVRVLGTHYGSYTRAQYGEGEGFIRSTYLTFPALGPPTIEPIRAVYQPGAQRVDVTLAWSPAVATGCMLELYELRYFIGGQLKAQLKAPKHTTAYVFPDLAPDAAYSFEVSAYASARLGCKVVSNATCAWQISQLDCQVRPSLVSRSNYDRPLIAKNLLYMDSKLSTHVSGGRGGASVSRSRLSAPNRATRRRRILQGPGSKRCVSPRSRGALWCLHSSAARCGRGLH